MEVRSTLRSARGLLLVVGLLPLASLGWVDPRPVAAADAPHTVPLPKELVRYDDGDSISIAWPEGLEVIRILGIDTPEVMHLEHNLPQAQDHGYEASGFLRGCFAVAEKLELLRSGQKDRYGRTLAYVYVDGKNYSVLVIQARLAYGPSGKFGDNGLPKPYAACKAAAATAGPLAFEEPYLYRRRLRKLSAWLKKQGAYPLGPPSEKKAK